jgi:hypothetical protein
MFGQARVQPRAMPHSLQKVRTQYLRVMNFGCQDLIQLRLFLLPILSSLN